MTPTNLNPVIQAEILRARGVNFQLKEFTNFLKQLGWEEGKDCFLSVRNIRPLLRVSVILLFPICWEVEGTDIAKNVRCCREEVLQNHAQTKWKVTTTLASGVPVSLTLYPESSTSKRHC